MAKTKKSTKRFVNKLLPKTIRKRKELQKKAKPFKEQAAKLNAEEHVVVEPKKKTKQQKSSLDMEAMNADDFFQMDFDADEDTENVAEETELEQELTKENQAVPKMQQGVKEAKPKAKAGKKGKKDQTNEQQEDEYPTLDEHRKQIKDLKNTQQEFYEYLQQNDPALLNFLEEDEEASDADADKEGKQKKATKAKKGKPEQIKGQQKKKNVPVDEEESDHSGSDDADDSEDDEDDDEMPYFDDSEDEMEPDFDDEGDGAPSKKSKRRFEYGSILTSKVLQEILHSAVEQKSITGLQELLSAFRSGCHLGDENSEVAYPFHIEDGKVFNKLMIACFENVDTLFNHHFKWDPSQGHQENKRLLKASKPLKKMLLSYFGNLIHFLRKKPDPRLFSYVLHQTDRMVDYFIVLPKLARKFLRILLGIWSKGEKSSRLDAFLNIRRLALAMPFPFIEHVLKGIYLTFVRNAKFTNMANQSSILFMMNCVTEIYGLDFPSTYQHMFVYIRQMAIHLRNCLIKKSKEAFGLIYNWQFINCVMLWGQILSTYQDQKEIQQLTYPYCQLVLGTLRLIPTPKFFPMRFLFIRSLNKISRQTGTYIPVGAPLVEVIQDKSFASGKRFTNTKARPIDFKCHFKVPKSTLASPQYWEGCAHEVLIVMCDFLAAHSFSISFPELVFPISMSIKKTLKDCGNPLLRRGLKVLLDKINSNIVFIQKKRENVNFSPKDTEAVANFTQQLKASGESPLEKYYRELLAEDSKRQTILRGQYQDVNEAAMRESNFDEEKEKKTGDGEDQDEDGDEEDGEDGEEYGDEDDGQQEEEFEEEQDEVPVAPKKSHDKTGAAAKKPKNQKGKRTPDGDIVEDFDLSAFD
eukprot:TRINITY_DN14320_c0_g1_i1.p1 TRINITY_DN14320_c0_g1~~TRINITY_DN14320_c0_g1_i1.p1  ORF type:complete len:863 (+),score=255.67 TRINITY_DN14320_c0_g1_i1:51-2639(+)